MTKFIRKIFDFMFSPSAGDETLVIEKETLKNTARKVKGEIEKVLSGQYNEDDIDKLENFMETIPSEVFVNQKLLSYSISDARKYLGDADIRETDVDYEKGFRERLLSYVTDIEALIASDK